MGDTCLVLFQDIKYRPHFFDGHLAQTVDKPFISVVWIIQCVDTLVCLDLTADAYSTHLLSAALSGRLFMSCFAQSSTVHTDH